MSKVKFGDVVREVKKKVDRNNNPYEHYVAGHHMDTEDLRIRRRGRFDTDDVGPAFIRLFTKGQILYGSRRTYLKKVAVADFDGVTANTTFVLETKNEQVLRHRLIPFIMLSEGFTQWSITKSKGSTNPYVLFSDLAGYEFELPSIEQQDKLVELLWGFVELQDAYNALLKQTDELVKSQFIELFGDPLVNSKGYKVLSFDEFAYVDANMTTDYSFYAQYPHIGIDSIEKDTGRLSGFRTVEEDNVKSGKYVFTPKHIVYSKIRPMLNKVALPNFYGLCSADAYPIACRENCNRVYLCFVLRSKWFLDYVVPLSGRTNMPKVNRNQLFGFMWPLPPKEEQNRFAHFVQQLDKSKYADSWSEEQAVA